MSQIDRINALTSNARSTWFALLGALVFVGITLMGVEHIDFYGVDRATTLPIVNFEVPTRYFFHAAPVLVAAIFGYFHLYLIRLWDALSVADPVYEGRPLGDVITPWPVADAALHLRARMREDACTSPRTMDGPAMLLNFLLAWGFGLFILAALWWQSMPAREVWMTAIAGLSLSISLLVGGASLAMAGIRARRPADGNRVNVFSTAPAMTSLLVLFVAIGAWTNQRTRGSPEHLAPIELIGEAIVERPVGWLPYALAKAEYRDAWCARKDVTPCEDLGEREAEFANDWQVRRDATLADMRRPGWSDPGSERQMDFRYADLNNAFLVGALLNGARMEESNLLRAQMEGASLREARLKGIVLVQAQMERADLSGAQMAGADLGGAKMAGADFRRAQMEGASLISAQMPGADLTGAQMPGANLGGAKMAGADLTGANMPGANFSHAQMEGADFRRAQMEGAVLRGAQMEGAVLSHSRIFGLTDAPVLMQSATLRAVINIGGALRIADLSGAIWDEKTDFRNAFLDRSVILPEGIRERMGDPCQWVREELSVEEFMSLWRWWLEKEPGRLVIPRDLRDLPQPSPERLAELGLTDCEWNQPLGQMP